MRSKLTITFLFALGAVAALAIAGCGGDGGDGTGSGGGAYGRKGSAASTAPVEPAPNPEEGATFVSLAVAPELGRILVDSKGLTLYDFAKDKGTESSCYGECAEVWPPLLSEGEPHASNGAAPTKLGTTERKDGTEQVTYAGHPLYTYANDRKPGEANGNDISSFGAQWYALEPSGAEAGD